MKSIIAKILFWTLVALSVLSVGLGIAATVTYVNADDGWILQSMVVFFSWMLCGVLVGSTLIWCAVIVSRRRHKALRSRRADA